MRRRRARSMAGVRHAVTAAMTVALANLGMHARAFDNQSIAKAYGAGVHAYFSGGYDRSYDDMSAVIEADDDPRDPRPFYFRGLAALKLGRLDEAEADFSAGANIEAESSGTFPISSALERIQGCERLQLERHRVRARVAFLQIDRERVQKRYSGIGAAQPEVLRRKRPDDAQVDSDNPFELPTPADAGAAAAPAARSDTATGDGDTTDADTPQAETVESDTTDTTLPEGDTTDTTLPEGDTTDTTMPEGDTTGTDAPEAEEGDSAMPEADPLDGGSATGQ